MGQASSRGGSSSPDRRSRNRRSAAWQPSATNSSRQQEQESSLRNRHRRYSSNVADLFRQRSAPEPRAQEAPAAQTSATVTAPAADSQIVRRPSRLARASSTFTNTIPAIFTRNSSLSARAQDRRRNLPSPARYPDLARSDTRTSAATSPPALAMPDTEIHSNVTPPSLSPSIPRSERQRPEYERASSSTLAERLSSLTPARAFPSRATSLRRRRSPLRRNEDQGQTLSRLLSVVAAATAATLTGENPDTAISNLRNATGGIEGDDGEFNGFLQALRSGRLTSALSQQPERPPGEVADSEGQNSNGPSSLEFFRMFRFGSSAANARRQMDSSRPSSSRSGMSQQSSSQGDGIEEHSEHRMVPILIVGIRALYDDHENTPENGDGVPSFLDALTSPSPILNPDLGLPSGQAAPDDRVRISRRRRASLGGLGLFSGGRDSHRSRPPHPIRSRSDIPNSAEFATSDSPPGPHPPPVTPASPSHSAFSSGASTPTNRSTYSSGMHSGPSSRRNSLLRRMTGTALEPTAEESSSLNSLYPEQPSFHSRPSRHRRLSDSDTPRFGSGSSRRNGVLVEPHPSLDPPSFTTTGAENADRNDEHMNDNNNDDNTNTGSSSNRSWIIYILGGSYPENHPILSTPSLFTDSPTYEDMLLLSSLLGPAKPPVASADEVAKAPGVLKIRVRPGSLVAAVSVPAVLTPTSSGEVVGVEEQETFDHFLAEGERCLVCLCDYEDGDEVRKLVKCSHLFHRECIDQWLTTGRNSCPLCRGQGVDEKTRPQSASTQESGTEPESEPGAQAGLTAEVEAATAEAS